MMLLAWILGPFCCGFVNPAAAAPTAGRDASTFVIDSQPLHDALQAYSRASGRSVLYDAGQVAHLRSTAIDGSLDPDAALTALLQGTGMQARFASTGAFVIVPVEPPTSTEARGRDGAALHAAFYGRVQRVATSILCADAGLSIGRYRLAISAYVSGSGELRRVKAAAQGHAELEPRIEASLEGARLEIEPPPALDQPIVLLVTQQAGRLKACAS
ncbi:STN domain-containing protein [Pigmentiphaga kullae]|uniref:Secretin/TonB-like protein n=1 Tax=Pigmentiphaga kullae TaxID=151784 RepID=A0A4Q7N9Y8_9BURK|nr:STN domain-containing protein [Pigmentiphaga kullae]RZS78857.1 secretin/TonB-like protein [Pigmentiphaga kullae]